MNLIPVLSGYIQQYKQTGNITDTDAVFQEYITVLLKTSQWSVISQISFCINSKALYIKITG